MIEEPYIVHVVMILSLMELQLGGYCSYVFFSNMSQAFISKSKTVSKRCVTHGDLYPIYHITI